MTPNRRGLGCAWGLLWMWLVMTTTVPAADEDVEDDDEPASGVVARYEGPEGLAFTRVEPRVSAHGRWSAIDRRLPDDAAVHVIWSARCRSEPPISTSALRKGSTDCGPIGALGAGRDGAATGSSGSELAAATASARNRSGSNAPSGTSAVAVLSRSVVSTREASTSRVATFRPGGLVLWCQSRRKAGLGHQPNSTITSPSWTTSPSVTKTVVTVPPCSANTGISIFIDSMITTGWPAPTSSPVATSNDRTLATISARICSATTSSNHGAGVKFARIA